MIVRGLGLLILIGASWSISAQSPVLDPEINHPYPEISGRDDPAKPPLARRNIWVSEYEPNSFEKKLLEPSVEDEQRFAGFLRQPDTGLIRMFPPGRRRVVSVADLAGGRRPAFGAFASLYSFSKEKHGNGLQGYVDPRLGWAEPASPANH